MSPTILVNLALSKIGQTLVKSLGDTSDKSSRLANLHYEPCLREALRAHFWSFAMKTVALDEAPRAATFANNLFRVTAKEDGLAGNGITIAVDSGGVSHSLSLDGLALKLTMGTRKRLTVSGTTSPDFSGVLYPSPATVEPTTVLFPGDSCWTSNGTATPPETGAFVQLHRSFLRNIADGTLEELVPMADYTASATRSTATQIHIFTPEDGFTIYWLYNDGVLPPRWVRSPDALFITRNTTVIPAGVWVNIIRSPGTGFVGDGILRQLQDSPDAVWMFFLTLYTDEVFTANYSGIGKGPETSEWTPYGGDPLPTGNPIVKATGLPATVTEMATLIDDDGPIEDLVAFTILGKPADLVQNMAPRQLSGGVSDEEIFGWSHAFQLPSDFIKAKTLWTSEGRKVDKFAIRRVGGKSCILCNESAVSLEYVHFIDDPDAFDSLFVKAFSTLLAAKLARAISGSDDLEARFLQIFETVDLPAARTASGHESDSNENHPLRELLDGNLTPGRADFFVR